MNAEIKVTQWFALGDHPLVTDETSHEFEFQEAKNEGAGFINKWTIVYPGMYILEINNQFITVLTQQRLNEIFAIEQ